MFKDNRAGKLSLLAIFLVAISPLQILSQSSRVDPSLFREMHWRNVGPFRGGRTRAVAGVPGEPNVFYVGAVNGGVWKSDDYGRIWRPIFDHEPTGSIGAIAVSPSAPNIVYVGSGEGLHRPDLSVGDGIYKSTDGGRSWSHLGLRDGQQISQMAIDPNDPNRLFVAVAGHPYGPNPERGIVRSTDGGETFQKVLYKDENIGGSGVAIDPENPQIVYATLWESREGPWENGAWDGDGAGIYKSTDGGTTWRQLRNGLPGGIVQAYVAIAASQPGRLFASVAVGDQVHLYRSADGGESWSLATEDPRPATRIGGGDLPVPAIDPKDPETVYMASIVTWRSADGGKTWTGIRGAPGGDDYQNIWINPQNPEIILLVSDQGALVSVNRGETWSSWYNQPTAQLYHVNADNAFPYRLCSGQQESGSVCTSSRGNDGEITFREWHPVAAQEYGYVVPDPLNPDLVYGGKLTRYDRRTGQAQELMADISRTPDFRVVRTEPIVFSPIDPHILYFASNTLWKTIDGGQSWKQVSPDLTRKSYPVPATVGIYTGQVKATRLGVIYAVAPSPLSLGRLWAGTDDGLIWLTSDGGGHWTNVTPPQLSPWQKVSILEASHFDAGTAYAAINTIRLDDLRPHILRTRDSGKTWTEITNGIPDNENVNVVREDPERKGLLFAGTEAAVYLSLDDGDHWQSLRLEMPATSVRDLLVKDDDLIAATHGRGFWILDDIAPLRQVSDTMLSHDAALMKPARSYRVRWDTNTDTPLPPDEPAGQNPPEGAIIDYYLAAPASTAVELEIDDSAGHLVRRYSSTDRTSEDDSQLNIPDYWVRPPQHLSGDAGLHRFFWDMHYPPLAGVAMEYPISAVYRNTAPTPDSPWVLPGVYTAVLKVNGHSYSQLLVIQMDPRVKTSSAGLKEQFDLSLEVYDDLVKIQSAINEIDSLEEQITALPMERADAEVKRALDALDRKLKALETEEKDDRPGGQAKNLTELRGSLLSILGLMQGADVTPTRATVEMIPKLHQGVQPLADQWEKTKEGELAECNAQLRKAGLPELKPGMPVRAPRAVGGDVDDGL